jgi:hypothetical protein
VTFRPEGADREGAAVAIEVRCGCGQLVYAEFRYAGQNVQCPHCRGVIAVPVSTASSAPPAPPVGEPRRTSFWATQEGQMWRGILVVGVLLPVAGVFVRGCQERENAKRPTIHEIYEKAESKRRSGG